MRRIVSSKIEAQLSSAAAEALRNHGADPVSIGSDVVEVARIERALQRNGASFVKALCTDAETQYATSRSNPAASFAGILAAKEAVYKALQLRWDRAFSWRWIQIVHDETRVPSVALSESLVTAWPEYRSRSSLRFRFARFGDRNRGGCCVVGSTYWCEMMVERTISR